MKRAIAYIVSFSAALLLGMFVVSTWLEFALVTALFSLAAIGVNFGHNDSEGECADRFDIFTN